MGYRKDTIRGFSWMAVLRAATRVLAFIETIILAKILTPSQFGAYGVALLVLGFLEVITETGVNIILIQEENIEKYIDSAWIVSIIRGIFISLIIILSTPLIAGFFNSPNSLPLLYLISIAPFLRGFINPSVVKFQKYLRFNVEFWYRFSILFLDSVVSITVSILTHNPVGIAIGFLSGIALELALSHIVVKPNPKLKIEREYLTKLFHRGKWVTASVFFNYLFHNADNIIVGRLLGTTALGIYQMAYTIAILPITEITDILSKVTLPILTKISGDKSRLQKAFLQAILVLTILTVPAGIILYFFPKEIVNLVLDKKWLAVISILPILALFGVIRAISGYSSTLFYAVGKQEYVSVVTFISIVGLIVPIIPLVINMGLKGAAISALIGALAAVPVFLYYTVKILRQADN